MKRSEARAYALSMLFEYSYNRADEPDEIIERSPDLRGENPSGFAKQLFNGVCSSIAEIDAKIENAAQNWKLHRISRVSLAVLRIAVYEMLYIKELPPEIVVNEALELTRKYDADDAVGFVNGVLGKIAASGDEK